MNELAFNPRIDNIFDFYFMVDFTTIDLAKEEYRVDLSQLKSDDDFYCFSEKKFYTFEKLFKKFNVKVIQ